MPAKDLYHDNFKQSLIKAGWVITHDPYTITFGTKDVFIDLGAERIFAAEKDDQKIAVEVKSFRGHSEIIDLEVAIGQYVFYHSLLKRADPERKLFLAVPQYVVLNTLNESIARPVIEDLSIAIIGFDQKLEIIRQWMN
ncbi:hypothetical protein TI05_03595 [Achromatium sp. WMS3]|nr:hypothetical protein TI05_03595 [Achromatium sp. WMS3]